MGCAMAAEKVSRNGLLDGRQRSEAVGSMTPTKVRIRARHAGHWPLAAIDKVPVMTGWPDFIPTNADIYRWAVIWPNALNTGVNNKKTPFVDVDIRNEDVARGVRAIIERYVGDAVFLVRTGLAPKFSVPWKTDKPFAKTVTTKFAEAMADTLGA